MILSEFLKKEGLIGVFYGRNSTDQQNVDTQKHVCYEFAKKHRITVIKDYVDENVSAFKKSLDKRHNLDELRKDARLGKFQCVLVYKADRLARRTDQHMQLWEEFRELGIQIILAQSEKLYTTDNPTDIIVEIGLSSLESENTRVRTRDNYNANTENGKWQGGNLPYGFRYNIDKDGNSIMEPIPDQVEKVKEIFKLYKRGYGFKRVAQIMNELHPKGSDDGEGKWVEEVIKSIITNPYYAGFTTSQRIVSGSGNSIRNRKDWKMGKCKKIPAIISEEDWNYCMELYEKKKNGEIFKDKFITPYLFSGILYCKECDVKVTKKNYTSGKKRKDGTSYGNRLYICPTCKQKWDVNKVHEDLIVDFLDGWYYRYSKSKKEVHGEIMDRIKVDIDTIGQYIESLKKELHTLLDKLREVENKQKRLMSINPEPDELQHALVQYRMSVNKRLIEIEKEIESKEKEKQQLLLTYGDFDTFKTVTRGLTTFSGYHFDHPEFRKLLLYLLDKVTISNKIKNKEDGYKYEIIAKVDLDERGTISMGGPFPIVD